MKLSDWVRSKGGQSVVARKLKVTPQTVHYWLTSGTLPRLEMLSEIYRVSGGQVTAVDIIKEATEIRKRGRK